VPGIGAGVDIAGTEDNEHIGTMSNNENPLLPVSTSEFAQDLENHRIALSAEHYLL
jgi:hypothetical protein